MKTARQLVAGMNKAAFDPEIVAQAVANNADDVVMALLRREQRKRSAKTAGVVPDYIANNYFFSNPYGLDFHTWAGMQDTTQGEDIPPEPMPEVEGEEPPYDADLEAAYMPNAPDESTEPNVSPAPPVPVPDARQKKQAMLLHNVAQVELRRRGLLKAANGDEEGKPVVRKKVEEFLRRNPRPEDSEFHAFADRQGYNTHAAEEVAYRMAAKKAADLIPGGKAQGMTDADFSKKQIAMGEKIEKEHTPDPAKAREIARDHLEEFPGYYTELKKMEKRLEEKRASYLLGRLHALSKMGIDASQLLGQDEQRKDDMHQQQLRHNEETHQLEMAKQQLELQQAQETFSMKQQQQAQKNQEQIAQQQMAQQMQAQQQQQMSQQYLSNMAGGGQPTQGMQQPPQQGMMGPR